MCSPEGFYHTQLTAQSALDAQACRHSRAKRTVDVSLPSFVRRTTPHPAPPQTYSEDVTFSLAEVGDTYIAVYIKQTEPAVETHLCVVQEIPLAREFAPDSTQHPNIDLLTEAVLGGNEGWGEARNIWCLRQSAAKPVPPGEVTRRMIEFDLMQQGGFGADIQARAHSMSMGESFSDEDSQPESSLRLSLASSRFSVMGHRPTLIGNNVSPFGGPAVKMCGSVRRHMSRAGPRRSRRTIAGEGIENNVWVLGGLLPNTLYSITHMATKTPMLVLTKGLLEIFRVLWTGVSGAELSLMRESAMCTPHERRSLEKQICGDDKIFVSEDCEDTVEVLLSPESGEQRHIRIETHTGNSCFLPDLRSGTGYTVRARRTSKLGLNESWSTPFQLRTRPSIKCWFLPSVKKALPEVHWGWRDEEVKVMSGITAWLVVVYVVEGETTPRSIPRQIDIRLKKILLQSNHTGSLACVKLSETDMSIFRSAGIVSHSMMVVPQLCRQMVFEIPSFPSTVNAAVIPRQQAKWLFAERYHSQVRSMELRDVRDVEAMMDLSETLPSDLFTTSPLAPSLTSPLGKECVATPHFPDTPLGDDPLSSGSPSVRRRPDFTCDVSSASSPPAARKYTTVFEVESPKASLPEPLPLEVGPTIEEEEGELFDVAELTHYNPCVEMKVVYIGETHVKLEWNDGTGNVRDGDEEREKEYCYRLKHSPVATDTSLERGESVFIPDIVVGTETGSVTDTEFTTSLNTWLVPDLLSGVAYVFTICCCMNDDWGPESSALELTTLSMPTFNVKTFSYGEIGYRVSHDSSLSGNVQIRCKSFPHEGWMLADDGFCEWSGMHPGAHTILFNTPNTYRNRRRRVCRDVPLWEPSQAGLQATPPIRSCLTPGTLLRVLGHVVTTDA